jgi:hypothetical protein
MAQRKIWWAIKTSYGFASTNQTADDIPFLFVTKELAKIIANKDEGQRPVRVRIEEVQ